MMATGHCFTAQSNKNAKFNLPSQELLCAIIVATGTIMQQLLRENFFQIKMIAFEVLLHQYLNHHQAKC